MKWLTLLFIATISPSLVGAADSGTTAADFLNLGIGPRAVAMGEAQVGLADDVYATYWNPAGLATLDVQEAGFNYTQYLENITEQYAAYAVPRASLGTFAGSITYLNIGKFQGFDATGQPTGDVGASDTAFALSYARTLFQDRRFGSSLSLGLTGKYIQEHLDTVNADAYATDLGALWAPGRKWGDWLEGWKAGLAARNIGTTMRFDQESFDLPRTLVLGVSYTGQWRDELVTLALDGRRPYVGSQSLGVGLEIWTLRMLVLRAGYTSQSDIGSGLRFGGGLRFKTVQVDYAFANAGDFGATHRFGLTLKFGKQPENSQQTAQRWYEKGLKDYRQKRFTEALVEFNKALEIDPSHPDALKMMKQTYEEIKTLVPE